MRSSPSEICRRRWTRNSCVWMKFLSCFIFELKLFTSFYSNFSLFPTQTFHFFLLKLFYFFHFHSLSIHVRLTFFHHIHFFDRDGTRTAKKTTYGHMEKWPMPVVILVSGFPTDLISPLSTFLPLNFLVSIFFNFFILQLFLNSLLRLVHHWNPWIL